MATVSGACVVAKVSGLLQVREDTAPSKLLWKAIDQDKSLEIPLNNLHKLQASPEASPKMLLRLFYYAKGSPDVKDIKLTFNNRLTMTAVKEALQTIVARQKTVIKDPPTARPEASVSAAGTPTPGGDSAGGASPAPGDPLDFSSAQSLSDAALLKNRQLQQKLLLEDKTLRNIFAQSVIKFKLSPAIFWSTRTGQLRTYALSICQHRGPYNVLSTIKPVATSDNQVNVNVTRDTINEIFETYPIIRRAFSELVPEKLNEGEFWSRFFNSKLFRRLRGDKINNTNTRGDIVIDKYLYVDADFVEAEETGVNPAVDANKKVNKFIDLAGNEVDNSQKLGTRPDFTMKFTNDPSQSSAPTPQPETGLRENEMLVLMKNMNKLSSKMVGLASAGSQPSEEESVKDLEKEVEISDLTEADEIQYIELNLDEQVAKYNMQEQTSTVESLEMTEADYADFLRANLFQPSGADLKETYISRSDEITRATQDITALVKHNFRTFKLTHHIRDVEDSGAPDLLTEAQVQELITFNITLTEFLLHFWNLFMNGGNPVQLKKLFTTLRNCQSTLTSLKEQIQKTIKENEVVKDNERLQEKVLKDLDTCISPLQSTLAKATSDYIAAVRAANDRVLDATNENGKRPLVES